MDKDKIKSNIFLLITAAVWGSGYVAQRSGIDYIGPFYFTGIRFFLGAMVLIPILVVNQKKKKRKIIRLQNII